MNRTTDRTAKRCLLITLALTAVGEAQAGSPCDLVTEGEAARILGIPAVKKTPRDLHSKTPGCLIRGSEGGSDSLRLSVETISVENAPRLLQHIDDERGDEIPSMHGETWYEISVPDSKHPDYRRMVVHRDRTSLILEMRSAHQKNAKAAFEKTWYEVSQRLPTDEKE
jgi:hypothetical protein